MPDANTLIYLAQAELLDVLSADELWVGDRVYEEAVEQGKAAGYGDAFLLERYLRDHASRKTVDPTGDRFDVEVTYFGGPGETETFLLAEEAQGGGDVDALVVTSDQVAYKKLRRRGVEVIRTDMLLYQRFLTGGIGRQDLYDQLVRLRRVNATTDQRIAFLMEKAEAAGTQAAEADEPADREDKEDQA